MGTSFEAKKNIRRTVCTIGQAVLIRRRTIGNLYGHGAGAFEARGVRCKKGSYSKAGSRHSDVRHKGRAPVGVGNHSGVDAGIQSVKDGVLLSRSANGVFIRFSSAGGRYGDGSVTCITRACLWYRFHRKRKGRRGAVECLWKILCRASRHGDGEKCSV